MFSFALPLLMGSGFGGRTTTTTGEAAGGPMSGVMSFLPFILIIAVFYFLIIRPQNKKQKETKKMLEALKKGDKVVTIGGVHGTISTVRESTVVLRVDDNTKIEFSRSAIGQVTSVAKDDDSDEKESKTDYDVKEIK
ncbi:MAG: preprotein translocase subunit YajC [Spirochaetaceae bacterium]|jgi:preprotein translocase subunit YajC|nr:preprotein translocase subunit YajC [Spirochaetaceae bacterium]